MKNVYPFIYWGEYFNTLEEEKVEMSGCTFAENYTEAMSNIEEYYGDELISIHLEPLEESSILEFSDIFEAQKILKRGN